jgi:hypothetical protein
MRNKSYSIDQLSTETSRRAHAQSALMRAELRKLRASLRNIDGSARQPVIRPQRTWTKKTTSDGLLGGLAGLSMAALFGESLSGNVALGGILSPHSNRSSEVADDGSRSQLASALVEASVTGSRNR